LRGRCSGGRSLDSKEHQEIVRADKDDDSASQSVVERRRQGTQSAFESSNIGRKDIAKPMKRTEGALRRKAGILGIGLGHDR
jgi:hypothetical protein